MTKERNPRLIIQCTDGMVSAVYGDPCLSNVEVRIVDYDVEDSNLGESLWMDFENDYFWLGHEGVAPLPDWLPIEGMFKEDDP